MIVFLLLENTRTILTWHTANVPSRSRSTFNLELIMALILVPIDEYKIGHHHHEFLNQFYFFERQMNMYHIQVEEA